MWPAHDGMGWWMLFAALVWVLFVGLVVWFVVVVSRDRSPHLRAGGREDAIAIARQRNASGAIDRETVEQLRRDLES